MKHQSEVRQQFSDNLINALKAECLLSSKDCYPAYQEEERHMVRVGAFNHQIARRLDKTSPGNPVSKTYYHLKKLELEGLVISLRSPGAPTRWWPVGFLDHLKAESLI